MPIHYQRDGSKLKSRHLHNLDPAYLDYFLTKGIFETERKACKKLSIREAFSINYMLYFELSLFLKADLILSLY